MELVSELVSCNFRNLSLFFFLLVKTLRLQNAFSLLPLTLKLLISLETRITLSKQTLQWHNFIQA